MKPFTADFTLEYVCPGCGDETEILIRERKDAHYTHVYPSEHVCGCGSRNHLTYDHDVDGTTLTAEPSFLYWHGVYMRLYGMWVRALVARDYEREAELDDALRLALRIQKAA